MTPEKLKDFINAQTGQKRFYQLKKSPTGDYLEIAAKRFYEQLILPQLSICEKQGVW